MIVPYHIIRLPLNAILLISQCLLTHMVYILTNMNWGIQTFSTAIFHVAQKAVTDNNFVTVSTVWSCINLLRQNRCRLTSVFTNSSLPGQHGCHFLDGIFRLIFVNEKFVICFLLNFYLSFFSEGPIDNIPALVWIMAFLPKSRKAIIWSNVD